MAESPVRWLRPGQVRLQALPPLSLYVHLPWCLLKCPYCDFNSHAVPRGELPEGAYLDALRADLEASLPLVWGRRVVSVFIGGGTPSLFSPEGIGRLIGDIRARLPLVPGCEITLEANPGTFERERFRAFRDAGVTRLSLGVQSFDDASLKALGRVHDAGQARAAAAEAAEVFATFNLDLMYALPHQGLEGLREDLLAALSYQPPHLSVYHLTMEPNTRFASAPPSGLPDEDLAARMLDEVAAVTTGAGLSRYEVSAYARAGHACTHNLNYWTFGDYLGIGAGAHGKLSFPERIVRQVRWREPSAYIEHAGRGQAVSNEHEVTADELPFEFMLGALRLREGFEPRLFVERTGLPWTRVAGVVQRARARGLLALQGDTSALPDRVAPTVRGFDFLSDLQQMFLPDGPA